MFDLGEYELDQSILGVGDGPAAFNAELTALGNPMVSLDPIYRFSAKEIERRIREVTPVLREQLAENASDYVWTEFLGVEHLIESRLQSMARFLSDFGPGKTEGRYICGELPNVPFTNNAFDLVICSHLLFLYDDMLDLEFHRKSIVSLCNVAPEIRIFPIVDRKGSSSRILEPLTQSLVALGYQLERRKVSYCFQKAANQMLIIRRGQSDRAFDDL